METTPRTFTTPEKAKYKVWRFGGYVYCETLEDAEDSAGEFWCRDNSQIMELEPPQGDYEQSFDHGSSVGETP